MRVRKCDLDLVRHLLPSFSSAARVDCLLAWQMTLVLRGVKRDRDVKWNMKRTQEDNWERSEESFSTFIPVYKLGNCN